MIHNRGGSVTKARDFVGPYRLTRLIRAGHACQVWEAIKDDTKERFALKMLRPDKSSDRQEVGYLKHEYEVGKDLNHPNVIRIYEFVMDPQTPYLALELYSALNLKLILREGHELIAHLAEKIAKDAANGLHYFHERGWIHCDLKPDNMLVDDEGNLKLIDFTIAQKPKKNLLRFLGVKQPVRGTRSYMSPEQIRGETLDRRADVYSFGCVMFELLTGRPPYTASSPNELLEKHLKAGIPSVMVYNNNVSRECADLIRRMIAKKKEARPQSMWEVLQEFRTLHFFTRKPQAPEKKLSEMEVGPLSDADSLKQRTQQRTFEDEET